jgi:hypothetical protein
MSSEWMKVMLDEIARKKAEANEAQAEFERREGEQEANPSSGKQPVQAASRDTTRGKSSGGRPPQ